MRGGYPGLYLFLPKNLSRYGNICPRSRGNWLVTLAILLQVAGVSRPGAGAQAVPAPTVSVLTANQTTQTYQLTCAANGPALSGVAGPTGAFTFTDVTAGQTLGTAPASHVAPSIFGPPQIFPAGDEPVSIAVGDFNGDGKPDVVFGNSDGSISVLLGNGDGAFQAPVSIGTPATLSFSMISGDFNGDGKLDLALEDWISNNVYVLLGNGDGTFQPPLASVNSAGSYGAMAAADVNGDGKLDLVLTDFNTGGISVLVGKGDGTFKPAIVTPTEPFPGGVVVADFNGDGKPDLMVASMSAISFFPGNGDGTFGTPTGYPVILGVALEGVLIADFNGDGKADVAVTSIGGSFVLLGNGDGTFQAPSQISDTSYPGSYIVARDFGGDGKIGLVTSGYEASNVEVFLGQGDGTFQWFESLADGGDGPGPLAAADFSGYGRPDLVIGNTFSENASILFNGTVSATGTLSGVTLPAQPPPSHNIQCSYSGNNSYAGSMSNLVALLAESVAIPTISPAGGIYNSPQTAGIADATRGATIYFTTDGTTPTETSTPYTSPIPIANGEVLTAIAYKSGYLPSNVATAAYTLQAATPAITPVAPYYGSPQTVTITDATGGAAIYYTLDGTAPTSASKPYSSDITVTSNLTLEAIAIAPGFTNSAVATFVLPNYAITVTPATRTITAGHSVAFSPAVVPVGRFSSPVTFSCSALPAEASCLFNPGTVIPAGSSTSTILVINTTAATSSRIAVEPGAPAPARSGGMLVLAGALGILFSRRRRGLRLLGCVLIAAGATLTGCGGTVSSNGGGGGHPGTPPGTYTMTLSGAGPDGMVRTAQITLVVQ